MDARTLLQDQTQEVAWTWEQSSAVVLVLTSGHPGDVGSDALPGKFHTVGPRAAHPALQGPV